MFNLPPTNLKAKQLIWLHRYRRGIKFEGIEGAAIILNGKGNHITPK
jgi:hypothetical protein